MVVARWGLIAGAALATASSAVGQMHSADADASKALAAIVQAYRTAPGLSVKTTLLIGARDDAGDVSEPPLRAHWILLPERRLRGEFGGYTVRLGDGELHAIHESRSGLYHKASDGDSPYYALMQRFVDLPWPTLALAIGEVLPEEVSMQLHTRAPWLQPTNIGAIDHEGKALGRLKLTSDYERMTLDFDPTTHYLVRAEVVVHDGPFVTDGVELVYRYEFEVKPLAKDDPNPTALDLGGRQHADELAAIAQPAKPEGRGGGEKLVRGREAPRLSIPSLDGADIDLAKLRERLIVVDFWATWCGPCRQALPEMAALARWAKANDLPVEVIAVNTTEQSRDLATRRERVREFVAERGNQLDGLRIVLDLDGNVAKAWGVTGLPMTVVLDADGRVVSVRTGFRPGEGERLKEELLDLFEGAADPARPERDPVF